MTSTWLLTPDYLAPHPGKTRQTVDECFWTQSVRIDTGRRGSVDGVGEEAGWGGGRRWIKKRNTKEVERVMMMRGMGLDGETWVDK